MGIISQLEIVNDMLATLGEAAVNSLTTGHPLVTTGIRVLTRTSAREQTKGWWFNTELVELTPDTQGNIFVPEDTLKVDPWQPTLNYTQRGRVLYNLSSGSVDPTVFTEPVLCILTRLLPFDDLPATAQFLVSAAAQLTFHLNMNGDETKLKLLRDEAREALVLCNAEHIRSVNANLINNPSTMATLGGLRGSSSGLMRIR